MKIAMFSDCYLDFTGGIVSVMNAQKKALENRGHTVYIFSTAFASSKKEKKHWRKKNIFIVPSCKIFFWKIAPISRRPKIIERWLVRKHPEIKDFDIFYTHYEAGCSVAAIRLGKQLKIPVVQMMHGREDMGESNIIPFGLRTIVGVALNIFHSWYLPHPIKIKKDDYLANSIARAKMWEMMVNHANAADVVLTPSQHFADKLKHYGVSKNIQVVPNGIDDDWFPTDMKEKEIAPHDTLNIIWHSRVSAEKRMMVFLKALTKVSGKWRLDVFGGGGDAFRAKKFAKRHKLNVHFYGNVDFKTIYKRLLKSNLDVLVSYNFDTFGMTLIEAEAVGVPVLICDPDLAETVPRGGLVLAPGPDPEQIASSIDELINHPEKLEKMSEVMLKHREEVLMSKRIIKLEKIFMEVV